MFKIFLDANLVVVDGKGSSGVGGEGVGGRGSQVELVLLGGEADLCVDGGLDSILQNFDVFLSKS